MSDDTRDKVIGLERDVKHLTETVARMDEKVTQMHELMIAGRGVAAVGKWGTPIVAAVVSFAVTQFGVFLPR